MPSQPSPSPSRPRVAIIGGGISGLAAAWHLTRDRSGGPEVVLLEGSGRAGGALSTVRAGSFLLEEGADSFVRTKPAGLALARQLGLEGSFQSVRSSGLPTLLAGPRGLLPLPRGMHLFVPGRIIPLLGSPLLSPAGRLRALADLVLPRSAPSTKDESVADFVRRRFGPELLDRIAQPLASGIYSGDPEEMSLAATFPDFARWERDRGSLIRAVRSRRRAGLEPHASGPRTGLFVTLREGMQAFPEALERALPPGTLRRGTPVTGLLRATDRDRAGIPPEPGNTQPWSLRTPAGVIGADAVILAVPVRAAASLLAGLDADLGEELAAIPSRACATVNLAWAEGDVPALPEANGFLCPSSSGSPLLACTFTSRKYDGRSSGGDVLLRAFVGGPAGEPLCREEGGALHGAIVETGRILGIRAAPSLARESRYPEGLPVFRTGHAGRIARIGSRVQRHPGLALAGNYLEGVGISDCVESGRRAAEATGSFFSRDPRSRRSATPA